ncbi:MAG: S-adenosylmethionine:tRNA ribosyltransferase-isomerase [Prevotella sp.]|nr:S-adenosylmethionine:tRNA ribosyltransferase-isomerase [Prevotella sp.]
MDTKHICISDYHYELPDERIAKFPVTPRDHSQLLVYDKGTISDDHFYNLASHLPERALMVFNNTKVIRARMLFHKSTGALIEIFLLEPYAPADYEQMFLTRGRCTWLCLVGNLKKWKEGTLERQLTIGQQQLTIRATRGDMVGTSHAILFEWDNEQFTFAEILEAAGQLPIPPYLNRETQQSDLTTYQTVYSKIKGSVAAPTAGLHFTPEVLASLDSRGIIRDELTLHVGAGTFKPVKSREMADHVMHTEHVCVGRHTLQRLLDHQCQAIAVGTTSVRTLESLYYMGLKVQANSQITEEQLHVDQWEPYEQPESLQHPSRSQVAAAIRALLAWLDENAQQALHASTQIIIAPGYEFKIVSQLITNFHQPQSTLLLLVSAFTKGHWREIYRHALSHDYRFLSYGDSSLLTV